MFHLDDNKRFDFGDNWARFSRTALSPARVRQAREEFIHLMGSVSLQGRLFLDIGYGQGLSLLIAAECGARVVGCDINPVCAQVLDQNRRFFPTLDPTSAIPLVVGSILDEEVVEKLRRLTNRPNGTYDIVHSWGALHHTGALRIAIDIAASLTAPGGFLVLAIYNRHWSSPAWAMVKRWYCSLPALLQRIAVWACIPPIFAAKLLVTRANPLRQQRGMDFYYNAVDWVGGHPYEYADVDSIVSLMQQRGFVARKVIPAQVPTGCNQFVFVRAAGEGL